MATKMFLNSATGGIAGRLNLAALAARDQPISTSPPDAATPVLTAPEPARASFPGISTVAASAVDRPIIPNLRDRIAVRPTTILPGLIPFLPTLAKTTTQLARSSLKQLSDADPAVVRETLNAISNAGLAANRLMNTLERHVKVGEVLNELADRWSDETKTDFANTFRLDSSRLPVMDCLVSIAVLNDPDLEEELRGENLPPTTDQNMIENRRIVWQYPPAGTPLDAPYLVLVAVERQDVTAAEDAVQSIVGELTTIQNVKLPRTAAQKLG